VILPQAMALFPIEALPIGSSCKRGLTCFAQPPNSCFPSRCANYPCGPVRVPDSNCSRFSCTIPTVAFLAPRPLPAFPS
jgi:hypothetical protein